MVLPHGAALPKQWLGRGQSYARADATRLPRPLAQRRRWRPSCGSTAPWLKGGGGSGTPRVRLARSRAASGGTYGVSARRCQPAAVAEAGES
jgi:hypothetical protein